MRWGLVIVVLVIGACDCSTRVGDKRFVCASDDHCAEGFVCSAGECVRAGSTGGGVGGGSTAGGQGGGVAGGGDAGGGDAGGGDAGGGDAGGAAGGGTAGGGTAGGGMGGGGMEGLGGGAAGGVAGGGAGGTAGGGMGGGMGGGTAGGMGGGMMLPTPTGLVFITTPPAPLLAGACFADTVQARIGPAPAPVPMDTTVGLSVSLTGGSRFYADAACTMAIATTTIAAGSSTATFYVKPITGAGQTLSASAPFGTAMQALSPRPVVRRGSCSYNPGTTADGGLIPDSQIDCVISPAQASLGTTFLLTAISGGTSTSSELMARCWLNATDRVRCERSVGADNPTVTWQTVELPSGLSVQHVRGACPASDVVALTLSAVNPASTFVLKTNNTGGASFDDEETSTLRLTSSTTALLETDGCDDYAAQFVDLSGVTVTRAVVDAGFPADTYSLELSGLPASSPNTTLLTQVRTSVGSFDNECALLVRGDLPTSSSVQFTRSGGTDAGCNEPIDQLVYERIDFGSRGNVQKLTVTIPSSSSVVNVPISPVDTTRTVVFSSSQIFNGQGGAEIPGGTAEIDEAAIRMDLTSPTNVRLLRGDEDRWAIVTFFVVELEP